MNLRVAVACEVKVDDHPSRSESEAEEAAQSAVADAKPSDLRMSRVKVR